MERIQSKRPERVKQPGPIPGSAVLETFRQEGARRSALRELEQMGFEVGPDETRSVEQIVADMQADAPSARFTGE